MWELSSSYRIWKWAWKNVISHQQFRTRFCKRLCWCGLTKDINSISKNILTLWNTETLSPSPSTGQKDGEQPKHRIKATREREEEAKKWKSEKRQEKMIPYELHLVWMLRTYKSFFLSTLRCTHADYKVKSFISHIFCTIYLHVKHSSMSSSSWQGIYWMFRNINNQNRQLSMPSLKGH